MSLCIGILSTESGTEGVDITKGLGKGFTVKLSGNGKTGFLSKEVLMVIGLSVNLGKLFQGESSYLKHFSGTFRIRCGNNRSMYINKASFLEKGVNSEGNLRTNSKNSLEGIGSGAKMRNASKIFQTMSFLLKRVIGFCFSLYKDGYGLQLKLLFCIRCC